MFYWQKPQTNSADFQSVAVAKVHNIGAGGVQPDQAIDMYAISDKRFNQYCYRTKRSVGGTLQ